MSLGRDEFTDWRQKAHCIGAETSFDGRWDALGLKEQARNMCAECPVFIPCARHLLAHPLPEGEIRAGLVWPGDHKGARRRAAQARKLAEKIETAWQPTKTRRDVPPSMPPQPNPGNCLHCGVSTVSGSRASNPDARRYGGHGLCETCRQAQRRALGGRSA